MSFCKCGPAQIISVVCWHFLTYPIFSLNSPQLLPHSILELKTLPRVLLPPHPSPAYRKQHPGSTDHVHDTLILLLYMSPIVSIKECLQMNHRDKFLNKHAKRMHQTPTPITLRGSIKAQIIWECGKRGGRGDRFQQDSCSLP